MSIKSFASCSPRVTSIRTAFFLFATGAVNASADLKWDSQNASVTAAATDRFAAGRFTFTNDGLTEIRISKVLTSCGCTSALASKEVFLPKEKGDVKVIYKIGDQPGIRSESVTLELEGSTVKTASLTLKVTLPPLVALMPARLTWASGEDPVEKESMVQIVTGAPFQRLHVKGQDLRFDIKLTPGTQQGRYHLTVIPKRTSELIRSVIILESDVPREKPFRFPIYIWIR